MAAQTFSQTITGYSPGGWTNVVSGPNTVQVVNRGPETLWLLNASSTPSGTPETYFGFNISSNVDGTFVHAGESSPIIVVESGEDMYAVTYGGIATATFITSA